MKLVGLMPARNEDWILRASMEAALRWVDHLVFLDHASTDESCPIASVLAVSTNRVTIIPWEDGEHWAEMDARQKSLDVARELGATHCAIIDADEILTHNNLAWVRGWFEGLQPRECLDVPMIAPWGGLDAYSPQTSGVITLGFADAPDLCWKPSGKERYHHHQRPPHGSREHVRAKCAGGIFHLQFAARERMTWKHRHYLMTERICWPMYDVAGLNEKYHWWTRPPHGENLRPIPAAWWGDYDRAAIVLDGESWYAAECRELARKHGSETFRGLNLFGWTP